MRIALLVSFFIITSRLSASAQKEIENSDICIVEREYDKKEYIEKHSDKLKLILEIRSVTVGRKNENIEIQYSEEFTDESKIVKLSKEVALRVSVARVSENSKKYYLYKIHLFKKENGCWEDKSAFHSWDDLKLGTINHGYGLGHSGSTDYIGYSGIVRIE